KDAVGRTVSIGNVEVAVRSEERIAWTGQVTALREVIEERSCRAVVTQHRFVVGRWSEQTARDIEVVIRAENHAERLIKFTAVVHEHVDKGPGRFIVAEHAIILIANDVEVSPARTQAVLEVLQGQSWPVSSRYQPGPAICRGSVKPVLPQ